MPELSDPPEDHRTRVGARRRGKTRLRLLESAAGVFSRKGLDVTVIDDVIAAAGVSRGTFHNHFGTTSELLRALVIAISEEILGTIDPAVTVLDDPLVRLSHGARIYIKRAARDPALGRFITTIGSRLATRGQLIERNVIRDLTEAIARKQIIVNDILVARDAVLGTIFYGIETMLLEPTHEQHAEQLVASFLRALGVEAAEAEKIAYLPLPEIGPMTGPIVSALLPPSR